MRKLLVVTIVLGTLAVPAAASAAPTITLTPGCQTIDGSLFYGVGISVTGLPPNAEFVGSLRFSDGGGAGPATFRADAAGTFTISFIGSAVPETFTVFVTFEGVTTSASATVTSCAPAQPTSTYQCNDGGWRTFGDAFKNQGQCVAFVQRGPKP